NVLVADVEVAPRGPGSLALEDLPARPLGRLVGDLPARLERLPPHVDDPVDHDLRVRAAHGLLGLDEGVDGQNLRIVEVVVEEPPEDVPGAAMRSSSSYTTMASARAVVPLR